MVLVMGESSRETERDKGASQAKKYSEIVVEMIKNNHHRGNGDGREEERDSGAS